MVGKVGITPNEVVTDKGTCPFCGSDRLHDQYLDVDGFRVATRLCEGCGIIFTVEGLGDSFDTDGEDFRRLDAAWKRRA